MLSQKTVLLVWSCHREIETGKKLLVDMEEIAANVKRNPHAERLKDAFGNQQDLQLGIPCGDSSRRLLNVSPLLAVSIIKAHIANKESELREANEIAKIELLSEAETLTI